jgi:hypothetical protein
MGKKLFTVAASLVVFGCAISCGHVDPSPSRASETVSITSAQKREDQSLNIKSVEFFAHKGIGAKNNYAKTTQLTFDTESRLTVPEKFDILVAIENKGRPPIQYGEFILITTLEFIVAPNAPLNDVDRIIKEYSWSRDGLVDDVKVVLAPFLEPDRPARIEFTGFDLRKRNKVLSEGDTIERVWAMKATVHVLNRNMVEVAKGDAVIAIDR